MFKERTLFIVGAGASAELGLPIGNGLKDRIAKSLQFRFRAGGLFQGDERIYGQIRSKFDIETSKVYTRAGNELADTISTFISIDEALHYWSAKPEIVTLGKLAIANEIVKAEASSSLARLNSERRTTYRHAAGTWLEQLLHMALSAIKREDITRAFANVTLINFNYDRTVEQFLYMALQEAAAVSAEIAAETVRGLRIIRPYGWVGPLDWIEPRGLKFGDEHNATDLFALASRVRTYTEQDRDADMEGLIEEALSTARAIIFLGFGYHAQNMAIFHSDTAPDRRGINKYVVGTVLGIDQVNHEMLKTEIGRFVGHSPRVNLIDRKGAKMLNDLRPSIMMTVG